MKKLIILLTITTIVGIIYGQERVNEPSVSFLAEDRIYPVFCRFDEDSGKWSETVREFFVRSFIFNDSIYYTISKQYEARSHDQIRSYVSTNYNSLGRYSSRYSRRYTTTISTYFSKGTDYSGEIFYYFSELGFYNLLTIEGPRFIECGELDCRSSGENIQIRSLAKDLISRRNNESFSKICFYRYNLKVRFKEPMNSIFGEPDASEYMKDNYYEISTEDYKKIYNLIIYSRENINNVKYRLYEKK